jgi:hypothetical protein
MLAIENEAVRPILEQIAEGKARYLCRFHVQIAWPQMVIHGESHYFKTGKEGVRRSDGCPTAEYQAKKARRLWLGLDGKIDED